MLTVAEPMEGSEQRASKTFGPDGPVPYDAGRIFRFTTYPVADFSTLVSLLQGVEDSLVPAFVVPGRAKTDGLIGPRLSAQKHGKNVTLLDVPSRVLCFDFDNIQDRSIDPFSPQGAHDLIRYVGLPTYTFYRVVWSASTGMGQKLGAHVWTLSAQPLAASQRRLLYKRYGADPAVASPASPIYVQPPTFLERLDPFSFMFHGRTVGRAHNVQPRFEGYKG